MASSNERVTMFLLFAWLAYSFILKMEVIYSSEMLGFLLCGIIRTKTVLFTHTAVNLKSNIFGDVAL
jgi:hypothetical protein